MDFSKFLSLLDRKALFFTRADRLGDPFEGSYSKINVKLRPAVHKDMPEEALEKMLERVPEANKIAPRFTYVNCWHINDYESAAMWKLYPRSHEGIAIRSNFKLLVESLNGYLERDVYIGTVKYIDYDTEWLPEGYTFYPFLHKRKSFEHEHELRAIILKPGIANDGTRWRKVSPELASPELGLYVQVELATLIERVYVSPEAPEWFGELVTSVASKYNLQKEVKKSSLSDGPVY